VLSNMRMKQHSAVILSAMLSISFSAGFLTYQKNCQLDYSAINHNTLSVVSTFQNHVLEWDAKREFIVEKVLEYIAGDRLAGLEDLRKKYLSYGQPCFSRLTLLNVKITQSGNEIVLTDRNSKITFYEIPHGQKTLPKNVYRIPDTNIGIAVVPTGRRLLKDLLKGSKNVNKSIADGSISKIVPEWDEWVKLYDSENYERYNAISSKRHIQLIFERLESEKGYFKKLAEKKGFSKEQMDRIRRVLFLHDFGEMLVLREDPSYSHASYLRHPEKSVEIAREILLRLGYAEEEIELDLLLIRYHSTLVYYAQYGESVLDPDPFLFIEAIGSSENLGILAFIQLVDAASVRERFENSLSMGLEERVHEITKMMTGIIENHDVSKEGQLKDKLRGYLRDIKRQNSMIQEAFAGLKENMRKRGIVFNDELLDEAFRVMHKSHLGSMRKDEITPYVIHCIDTARILVEEFGEKDVDCIIAALLHDVLEDTRTTEEALEVIFGKDVAEAVVLLSKPTMNGKYKTTGDRDKVYLRRLIYGTSRIRERHVLTMAQKIKIADRVNNLRTLKAGEEDFQKKIIDGTYEIFIPHFVLGTEVSAEIKKVLIKELVENGKALGLLNDRMMMMLRTLYESITDSDIPEIPQSGTQTEAISFVDGITTLGVRIGYRQPLVLALEGMGGSGKTVFAGRLKRDLERKGKRVVVFDVSDYLRSREERRKLLEGSLVKSEIIHNKRELIYDFERFKSEVLDVIAAFKNSAEERVVVTRGNLYNRATGKLDLCAEPEIIDRDTVVIIEGMHVLKETFKSYYDATFYLSSPTEECLQNVLKREAEKEEWEKQSPADIEARFKYFDVPSYRRYLGEYGLVCQFVISKNAQGEYVLRQNALSGYFLKRPVCVNLDKRKCGAAAMAV